ncbi:Right origin-binding protein [Hydrogenovibrio crunogenus]|uniref:Right origin-binding protein n=1 Tax=Hydrogenovibrio crunogenus TaxID=39765 RepID=A0A4P7NZI2_9GAMM|nr:AraC family transcriptional regulator [Hydrogenovibrio crunogenus]QBZ83250.1 Right origin-binding protein [Hydrogenovibrio crunogenus]
MSKQAVKRYANRMEQVYDYIQAHINDDLSIEKLSEVACFSKFHFHRQFSSYTGMTVGKFVLMQRLKRASQQLAYNQTMRIIDIALEANFESPEAFSRAFKNTFGQTPSQFRQSPNWQNWRAQYAQPIIERNIVMNIDLIEFEHTMIAALEHRGPAEKIENSLKIFREWRKTTPYSPVTSHRSFGLVYDDPDTVEPANFRFDLCAEVTKTIPDNAQGLVNKTIPGGKCAVLRHEGSLKTIGDKVRHLYCNWLPNSSEELRDFPCFFHYTNLNGEMPEDELITDIYLPLQ